MSIKLGNTSISSLYMGETKIIKVYKGEFNVYSEEKEPIATEDNCIWFNSEEGAISISLSNYTRWKGIVKYSINGIDWINWDGSEISSNSNIYLRGEGNTTFGNSMVSRCATFTLTGNNIHCNGNLENLLDYKIVMNGEQPVMGTYCFASMFSGCTNLISAPELPSMVLSSSCYYYMFNGCSSLTVPPMLPSTNLKSGCYCGMFYNCSALIKVPKLPATTLQKSCYNIMFGLCGKLYVYDNLSSSAQYEWRIPSNGVLDNTDTLVQTGMFQGCKGSRSSNDLAGENGAQYIYYIQNEPI